MICAQFGPKWSHFGRNQTKKLGSVTLLRLWCPNFKQKNQKNLFREKCVTHVREFIRPFRKAGVLENPNFGAILDLFCPNLSPNIMQKIRM